jgi:hypothetical protein
MRIRVLLLVAVVAGLAVLAGCSGGDEQPTPSPTPAASAGSGAELTRDQIIQHALEILEAAPDNRPDPSTATATRMTEREALETVQRAGIEGRPPDASSERLVWLVEVRGQFVNSHPAPPRAGRYFLIFALDGRVESGGFIPDATPTP